MTAQVIWPLPPTWGTWTEFLASGSGPSSHGSASTGSGLAATLQGRPAAGGRGCPAAACGSCSQPRLRAPPTVSVTPFMTLRDGDERHRHEVADVVPLNSRGGGGGREGRRHTERTCCAVSPPHGQEDTLPCPDGGMFRKCFPRMHLKVVHESKSCRQAGTLITGGVPTGPAAPAPGRGREVPAPHTHTDLCPRRKQESPGMYAEIH